MLAYPLSDRHIPLPHGRGNALRRVRQCTGGAVSVEYIVVVTVLGLTLATTLIALGPSVVQTWSYSRSVLYGGSP